MYCSSSSDAVSALTRDAAHQFRDHFGRPHAVAAYAPGRVEILGNHTDYNEGFVLSAAIDAGTVFLAAPSTDTRSRLFAVDVAEAVSFDTQAPAPLAEHVWANYVIGVFDGLRRRADIATGFDGLLLGNVPLGAGLSSSAALEMSAGLSLCALYGLTVDPLDLARIGQRAEHDFAGANCGLLDQISSLYGVDNGLVLTDFRSLDIQRSALGQESCFLMANTAVKHSLVDGEYNERRRHCEDARAFFSRALKHPVAALRDVSRQELETCLATMDPLPARRAAHVIGENERVLKGVELLGAGDLNAFGRLMFESHESSRINFENSCPELDAIVFEAKRIPGVLGARLSGGGFGGSAVLLVHRRDVDRASSSLADAYATRFHHPCEIRPLIPSAGARVLG